MVTRAAKDLLRNTIRSTGYHNRLLEEEEMWKQWEVEKGLTMMVTDDFIRRRMRMDERVTEAPLSNQARVECHMKELQRQKQAAREFQRDGDNFWNRKLMEIEEKDPDRWGHSGYKELYPEEFKTTKSSCVAKHKNSSRDSSLCSSKKDRHPVSKKRRKNKRKKRKRKHSKSIGFETKDHRNEKHNHGTKHYSPNDRVLPCGSRSSHQEYKSKDTTAKSPYYSSETSSAETETPTLNCDESNSSEDSGSLYTRPFLSDVSEAELQRRKEYLKRKLEEDTSEDSPSDEDESSSFTDQGKLLHESAYKNNASISSNGRSSQHYRHKRKLKSHIVNIK